MDRRPLNRKPAIHPTQTKPDQKRVTCADFEIGDVVTFVDRRGMPLTGKIIRLNQKGR
jgi:hypothetical protein